MNTDSIIGKLRYEIKAIIPDSVQWVDGSGLSRYNQMSPRSLVRVLEKLAAEHTLEVMQSFFPAGGLQGTIIDLYGDGEEPFIHAKTGTMKGVHCLSGYITTDSGRELIFSFMHNQFFGSNVRYKEEMEEILRYIKVKY
jgi:D-alanyl-D-alanine carboxypeptidase/D-alanyl-D-alanine-endopeptidase (penicillin-binding protein 4)